MSQHIQQTIDDLKTKRGAIDELIGRLEWFQNEFPHTAASMIPAKKAAKNGRTHGKEPRRASAVDVGEKGAVILATLKKHGGSMSPGSLAQALKLGSTATLAYQLKPLVKSKQVVVSGVTAGRRISLPGAKEAP